MAKGGSTPQPAGGALLRRVSRWRHISAIASTVPSHESPCDASDVIRLHSGMALPAWQRHPAAATRLQS